MQPMNRFKTSPVQHINRPAAPEGGGDPLLGALGGIIGGVLGAPLGPLGVAMGSSIGGSLAGKGDLSGVTPEEVALKTLTAGIPMPGAADATKVATDVATDAASQAATDAASQAATDAALAGATEAAATGAKEGLKGALSQQAATNLSGMAAPTIGEATTSPTLLGSVRNLFSPDGLTDMAKESAGGFIDNPSTVAELGINKFVGGLGRVKESLFKADGGPVGTTGPGGTGGVGYNNPQEDYSDSVKRSKLLKGVLAGGGLMGLLDLMGDDRMNLAKGGYAGKGCGCGPMANCNC
jgi:hypothetical protein